MAATFSECAETLYDNGYAPLPILPAQKRPGIKSWSNVQITPSLLHTWARKFPGYGVGLRGGDLVALDLDVTDEAIVTKLLRWLKQNVGEGMVRRGAAPKLAVFFRASQPFSRRDSSYYGEQRHHIEARSLETQTVAYGKHPKGYEYQWLTESTPLNTPLNSLPTISPEQITRFYGFFDALCEQARIPLQAENTGVRADSEDWMKNKYQITEADLRDALDHISAEDYHQWVSVGMALYHQYSGGPEGLELWDAWSARSIKYNEGDCEAKWATFHEAGRRNTVTLGTVLSLAQAGGWANPGLSSAADVSEAAQQVDQKPDRLVSFMERVLSTPAPPVEWLIPGFMPAHKVCLLIAPGGTGKSMFTLQMGFSVATGATLAGHFENVTTGNVLVLGAEDDEDDIHRRVQGIFHSFTDDFSIDEGYIESLRQAAIAHFKPLSLVGRVVQLVEKTATGHKMTGLVDKIIHKANEIGNVKLIIVDPLSRFGCGEEGPDMVRLVETLEHIRSKTGATVLAVHHSNKAAMREGGADQQYAARGHSALTDGVRFQMNMANMHPDEAGEFGMQKDEAGLFVRLAVSKTNYTAPREGIWLTRGPGGVLESIDIGAVRRRKRVEDTAEIDAQILTIVERRQKQGDPVSPRLLARDYAGEGGEIKATRTVVTERVDALIEEGELVKKQARKRGGGWALELPGAGS